MALSLPADIQIEILGWLDPVQVMQLRSVCRAWREEAPKTIRVVGLIDDFESNDDATNLDRCFASANMELTPLPGDGSWKGKFPALSFPRFHVLPNVRRVETEPTYSPWTWEEGARAVAEVCATWPDLEEIVTAAMPPRGQTIGYWTDENESPKFSALDLFRELRDRCPNLRVLSFRSASAQHPGMYMSNRSVKFAIVYPSRTPKPKEINAFAQSLSRLRQLEALDATEMGMLSSTAGRVLLKCVESFSKLRVFVAPESLCCRHKLFPTLLQNAPLLEELHIRALRVYEPPGCHDTSTPLVDALRAHGGLRVLTLHEIKNYISTENVVSAIEALPKLHTCSVRADLSPHVVDRIAAVLRKGFLRRLALLPGEMDCAQMERYVAVLRETNVQPLLRFPRDYYFIDMEMESVSSDRGEHRFLDDELLKGNFRAGELWAVSLDDGYVIVRMLEDDDKSFVREGMKSAWKAARATWPDADMHRFAESRLGDPRVEALGRSRPTASASSGAAE